MTTKTIHKRSGNARKSTRRRPRRRVHMGRLALICFVMSAIIVLLMAVVTRACSDELSESRSIVERHTPIPSAIERGTADARRALAYPAGTMERQGALIEIRALEHRLRNSGHTQAADDYIRTATDILRRGGGLSTDTVR